ncbi:MAG: outer membrane beta-barrel protein [Bacteroidota bacterium]
MRELLEGYEVPQPAADWNILAKKIDTDAFDHTVRERVQSVQIPFKVTDWEQLNHLLEAPFDHAIASKLAETAVPYDPAHWQAVEKALLPGFDQLIQEKVQYATVPLDPNSWHGLEKQLPKAAVASEPPHIRSFILDAILVVALAMVMLCPASSELSQDINQVKSESVENSTSESRAHAPDAKSEEELHTATGEEADISQLQSDAAAPSLEIQAEEADKQQSSLVTGPSAEQPQVVSEPVSIPSMADPVSASRGDDTYNSPNIATVSPQIAQPNDQAASENRLSSIDANNQTDYQPDGIEEQEAVRQTTRTSLVVRKQFAVNQLPVSQDDLLSGNGRIPSAHIPSPEKAAYPAFSLQLYTAGISSVAQFNEAGKPGYILGGRVNLQLHPNWGLVSGITYAFKQFEHTQQNFDADLGQWESQLMARFHMIEIPIHVRYYFPKMGKWTLYAQAGPSATIMLKEDYELYDPYSVENISNNQDEPGAVSNLNELTPIRTQQRIATYLGSLTFSPGVGIDLSKRMNLFLEPYFQFGTQRIGSQRKRLHSAGLGVGINFALPKK